MRALRPWLPVLAVAVAACAPLPPAPEPVDRPGATPTTLSDVDRAIDRHRQLAQRHRASGDLAAATAEWQILTLLAPQDPEFQRELAASRAAAQRSARESLEAGLAAQRGGQTERAIQAYVQALALDPAHADAARALRELDRAKYSRIQQDRAARAKPDSMATAAAAPAPAPATPRGPAAEPVGEGYDIEQALEMLAAGDLAGGLRDLRAWVDANPRQRAARQRIGSAVFDKGRELETAGAREQALAFYEAALALRGETPAEWTARIVPLKKAVADDLFEAGVRASRIDLKLAIAKWEACLRYDPQHARAVTRLKEARELQNRLQRIEKGGTRK